MDDGREGAIVRLDDSRAGQEQRHHQEEMNGRSGRLMSSVTERHDDGGSGGPGYGRLNDGQHPTGGGKYRIGLPTTNTS